MKNSAFTGPLVTLGAAVVVGLTLLAINVSQQHEQVSPPRAAAVVAAAPTLSTPPPTPVPPVPPQPVPFPAKIKYHSDIPTKNGNLTLDIKIDGASATAYACDNRGLEQWLAGAAVDGTVAMKSADGTSRLSGRHEGSTIVGDLEIGDKQWAFTAQTVPGYGNV
jgi:hypothetical protein